MSAAALSVRTLRGSSLRAAVFARDAGVCALCGADTEVVRKALDDLRRASHGSMAKTQWYRRVRRELGVPSDGNLWDADHRIPVSEGGASTLDNLRTLCRLPAGGCHGRETKDLRARLTRKPSRARAERRAKKREARR